MARAVDVIHLIGFAVQSLLYGAYCILFIASGCILYYIRKSRGANKVVIGLSILLFVSCTLHYATEFNHFYVFLASHGTIEGLANESPAGIISDIAVSTTDFLGDLILIYRCWVIWQHNYYVIILPLLAASAGLILSAVIGAFVTGTTGLAVGRVIVPMGLASFILPLCTNVMVTTLIIGRIWYMTHEAATFSMQRNSATQKAMNIIIESGALYFAVQCVFVVTYAMQHPAEYAMILITPPIYGISSTLIIIHLGLGLSSEPSTVSISSISWARGTRRRAAGVSVDMPLTPASHEPAYTDDAVELTFSKGDDKQEKASRGQASTTSSVV
ncbi:hypothetical protein PHLGIDRAFT_19240 [Phlebiopsis gigantea 11061_1 CR5-6]|uniref:Uncharacterized protein n=1 Tax=Phlebiopsis gigantea (strain 11061_1 CR5-6) TaxID=745531 RepID=A0A0C3S8B2_PHLG1|nr:hypothetical protein PHLGIDRAFT_19240 [Phlebiopsis gigantea 11061_1 CR5-6]